MTVNADILTYARAQLNLRVGDGECWTYAENAVTGAGGESSRSLTPNFSRNADFVWGDVVGVSALQAGDIVQFRNYVWNRTVVVDVTFPDGGGGVSTNTQTEGRSHHTAIVNGVAGSGSVEVLEQNSPVGSSVHTTDLVLVAGRTGPRTTYEQRPNSNNNNRMERAKVITTITSTVSGTVRGYRARPPS